MVELSIQLDDAEALALAQFLKRAGHSDYMRNAVDSNEAYSMLYAGDKVRTALADAGYAPR